MLQAQTQAGRVVFEHWLEIGDYISPRGFAGCDGWCSAAGTLLRGSFLRVASDVKRWSDDTAAATAASADGHRLVAEGLSSLSSGALLRWQLQELAARLQLQRAKCSLAEVPPKPMAAIGILRNRMQPAAAHH